MAFARDCCCWPAGKNALRFAPPLVVDDEDVDIAVAVLG